MTPFSNKFKLRSPSAVRPQTAVELTTEGALAATLDGSVTAPTHAFAPLAPGALVPGIAEANIVATDAVVQALRQSLDQLAPRSRVVTLVVPDSTVRIFILDFDSLPAKPAEVVPVLRFRLRKMVPFDVEHAAISYQVLAKNDSAEQIKVLATVMPGAILAEYEAAVQAAGYEPGAVMPSTLAMLAALDAPEPVLAANLSSATLTTSIAHGDDLLLYRTVELPQDDAGRVAEVERSVAVAAAYFEDTVGTSPRQLYYTGTARELERSGLRIVEIAPAPADRAKPAEPIGFAGVTGALAGAA